MEGSLMRSARANAIRDAAKRAVAVRRLKESDVHEISSYALAATFAVVEHSKQSYNPPRYPDASEWVKARVFEHTDALSEAISRAVRQVVVEKTTAKAFWRIQQHESMHALMTQLAERCLHVDPLPGIDENEYVNVSQAVFVYMYHMVRLAFAESSKRELEEWNTVYRARLSEYQRNPASIAADLRSPPARLQWKRPAPAKNFNQQAHKSGVIVFRWMLLWATNWCRVHRSDGILYVPRHSMPTEAKASISVPGMSPTLLDRKNHHHLSGSASSPGVSSRKDDPDAQGMLALWRYFLLEEAASSTEEVLDKRFPLLGPGAVSDAKRCEANDYLVAFSRRHVANQILSELAASLANGQADHVGFLPESRGRGEPGLMLHDEWRCIESDLDKEALQPTLIDPAERGKVRESYKVVLEAHAVSSLFDYFAKNLHSIMVDAARARMQFTTVDEKERHDGHEQTRSYGRATASAATRILDLPGTGTDVYKRELRGVSRLTSKHSDISAGECTDRRQERGNEICSLRNELRNSGEITAMKASSAISPIPSLLIPPRRERTVSFATFETQDALPSSDLHRSSPPDAKTSEAQLPRFSDPTLSPILTPDNRFNVCPLARDSHPQERDAICKTPPSSIMSGCESIVSTCSNTSRHLYIRKPITARDDPEGEMERLKALKPVFPPEVGTWVRTSVSARSREDTLRPKMVATPKRKFSEKSSDNEKCNAMSIMYLNAMSATEREMGDSACTHCPRISALHLEPTLSTWSNDAIEAGDKRPRCDNGRTNP